MRRSPLCAVSFVAGASLLAGCGSDSGGTPLDFDDTNVALASCEGCHTDYDALKEVYTPDSIPPVEGCSGPAPHIEPYDRVFMGGTGFADFKSSVHGREDCTACHNGVDGTADKATAHSGDFVRYPSFENLETCRYCHTEIVRGVERSLHYNGWGQKNSQITRAGAESFEGLHQGVQVGYEENCSTCHASCGSCHVNRPVAGGGGLLNDHSFASPDMRDNCTQCHSSRGGHAYFGVGRGTQPDVHLTQAGFTCTECHEADEMHSISGEVYEHRYQVEALPSCDDCHTGLATSNAYHETHLEDLNCHTCHAEDYNNCGSCHVAGEGARIHSHQAFKIGLNPLSERPYKFATLRRTLAAPDSWSVYGMMQLEYFDDKPLYNYATPHNIQLWTARTQVDEGATCSDNCHIIRDGDIYRNRELYLFTSDLTEAWEKSAAERVVVDAELPAAWTTGH